MASKRPHPNGPMDHQPPKAPGEHTDEHEYDTQNIDDEGAKNPLHDRSTQPNMERRQSGDRSKRLPTEVDASASKGDPPHGYGTEAPNVQGGGRR